MVVSDLSICCSVVGDGMVGKSSLIQSFVHQEPPSGYLATVVENYDALMSVYGDNYLVSITDFGGEHTNAFLKSPNNKAVFVVCYSVVDRESFRNVREFWIPSIKNLKKKHDIVLVATHVDIRESKDVDHVTFDEGFDLCREVNGHTFIECSAADRIRTKQVFESVVSSALAKKKTRFSVLRKFIGR
ncbi:cdc42 homolog [Crassostrea angulata]|nr:cdc42 homolog [Crassostrea angulata]